jgi:hypothetical protein
VEMEQAGLEPAISWVRSSVRGALSVKEGRGSPCHGPLCARPGHGQAAVRNLMYPFGTRGAAEPAFQDVLGVIV